MSEKAIFENNFRDDSGILEGKILIETIEQKDSRNVYDEVMHGVEEYSDYSDYFLNALNVNEINISSFGLLMKALSNVKKTSGYMILVMKEEILQKFMLSNPEMFDYYAIFFNPDEAIEYIYSKR